MAKFTVEKDKSYQAIIQLAGFEALASNEMIMEQLQNVGFADVEVTGDGNRREAIGIWPKETVTANLPSQIVSVEEVEIV